MKGYKTLAIGAAMVVLPPLLTYLAGINWSDYVSPQVAVMISGVIMVALRVVTNTPIGKALIAFMIVAVGLSFSTPRADAADLAVKAINNAITSPTPCVAQSCSGWYAGFGLMGDGSNADVIGNGINGSVFSSGGALNVDAGYQLWNGNWFAAVELGVGYEFTTNSNNVPTSGGSRFIGTELMKLGYNFFPNASVAVTTPSQSPVPLTVPANLLAASTPYLAFGGLQRRGISEWVNGAGVETVIAASWVSHAEYLYAPAQQGVPPTSIVRFGVDKHF